MNIPTIPGEDGCQGDGRSGGEDSHGVFNGAWLYDLGTEFSLQAGRDRHFAVRIVFSSLLKCLPETAPARNQRPPEKKDRLLTRARPPFCPLFEAMKEKPAWRATVWVITKSHSKHGKRQR